jgi:hypothetical protein
VKILEDTRYRLRIEFQEECTAQLALGIAFAVVALLSLFLMLIGGGGENLFWLLLSTILTVYAWAERISYGCLADRTTGQLTIFRRNGLGQRQFITYSIRDIDTVEVVTRNEGWGRPCYLDVCLKSGQRQRLMSYQSCAVQQQVVERLTTFLGITH